MKLKVSETDKVKIIESLANGVSVAELSETYKLHKNSIYNITKEARELRSEVAKEIAKEKLKETIPNDLDTYTWIIKEYKDVYLEARLHNDRKNANTSLSGMRQTVTDRLKMSGLDPTSQSIDKMLELLSE